MAAPKGNCFNPKGRPKGSKSKKTIQWEYFRDYCLDEGLAKFRNELNMLEKREYVNAYLHLLDYFKPKLQRFNCSMNEEKPFPIVNVRFENDNVNKHQKRENA